MQQENFKLLRKVQESERKTEFLMINIQEKKLEINNQKMYNKNKPFINKQELSYLKKKFSEVEIKKIISQPANNKVSGYDGLKAELIKYGGKNYKQQLLALLIICFERLIYRID